MVRLADMLEQAFANPNLEVFQLLHAHSPSITNYVWFMDLHSTLLESLTLGGGDPMIPNFLLDHDADPNSTRENMLSRYWNALFASIQHGHPFEFVEKLLDHGADITGAVLPEAIKRGDIPIIELVLQRTTQIDAKRNRKAAKKTNNRGIIALVGHRAKTLTSAEKQAKRRWWLPFSRGIHRLPVDAQKPYTYPLRLKVRNCVSRQVSAKVPESLSKAPEHAIREF